MLKQRGRKESRQPSDFFIGKYNENNQIIPPNICIYLPQMVHYKLEIVIS